MPSLNKKLKQNIHSATFSPPQ